MNPPTKKSLLPIVFLLGSGLAVAAVAAVYVIDPLGSSRQTRPAEEPFVGPSEPPGPAPDGMAWVPGGPFWMGYADSPDGDAPPHQVAVTGFWMDKTEVTNAQFEAFVKATGYKSVAELPPSAEDFNGEAPPTGAKAFSIVFVKLSGDVSLRGPWPELNPRQPNQPPWWGAVPGADWRHPEGPTSDIRNRMNHPVVHIAWKDAVAYAKWAGKRLPTEGEWECAARGGLDRLEFCWGSEPQGAGGVWRANTFQGTFPTLDTGEDGFTGAAPVGSYPPNGYGLYDMSGNVWEWCADWYSRRSYLAGARNNPHGPDIGDDRDGTGLPAKVKRGGSFLCADNYCRRYLPGTRYHGTVNDAANHSGFRCVKDR
jgi:sulfatase modifying factor 1